MKYNYIYLEYALILGVAGALQRDVGDLAGLGHDQHLHGLRHLPPRQHRRVQHLPVLMEGNTMIN